MANPFLLNGVIRQVRKSISTSRTSRMVQMHRTSVGRLAESVEVVVRNVVTPFSMMFHTIGSRPMYDRWIVDALAATGTLARPLPPDEVGRLVGMIVSRFTKPTPDDRPLWETFHEDVARRRSDGWSLVCDYPEPLPIMLFEERGEFRGYEFSTPEDMRSVLAASPGFEFYVTNKGAEFVICHNHHDFIICVGSCREWLCAIEDG